MSLDQPIDRMLARLEDEIQHRLPPQQAAVVAEFANQFYRGRTIEDFANKELSDIFGSLLGSWAFLQRHDPALPKVRVFNPDYQKHGWQLGHTVVAIVARNMPFITDSIRGELNRRNLTIHNIHGKIFSIIRDQDNQLVELLPARTSVEPQGDSYLAEEVLLYLEIGRCTDSQELEEITHTLETILHKEVAVVVDDFQAMTARARVAIDEVGALTNLSAEDIDEVAALLQWLVDGNFTFLGYEELTVDYGNEQPKVARVKSSQLGLLKLRKTRGVADLQHAIATAQNDQELLDQPIIFSKSSVRSRVHRLVYPDYVLLRRYDSDGKIIGKHCFLGLYTSSVYTLAPTLIPLIRGKVAQVMARSGLDPQSHIGKDLARVMDVFPRDELFQSDIDTLFNTAIAVNQIQERRKVRLFVRHGRYQKFVNCLVYTPRDIYRTDLRVKIENLLCNAFGAHECEFTTYFSESILTRSHFVLRIDSEKTLDVDVKALEEEIIKVTMSWKEHLNKYLIEEFGEEQGAEFFENYGEAFSPGYMDDFEARSAVNDIKKIATLEGDDDIAMSLYRKLEKDNGELNLRIFRSSKPLALSDVMPLLENLGLRVESEHPYDIKRKDGKKFWVHEFSLTYGVSIEINFAKVESVFLESFLRVWQGDAESDAFNKLILGAGLGWRQIAMLRAYARYMKQIQFNLSQAYIADTLSNHLGITTKIVQLFKCRFNTDNNHDAEALLQQEQLIEQEILEALDGVENLSEDKVIRQYLSLINATLRTNYFQTDDGGELKNYFAFKLSPAMIPDMPQPVPMFEIFVYSPRVEGVHLRGGKVARGGLRWSDRFEDFRTEVLGLVKAQQVKNAVIVPMGAKGGFIAKQPPATGGREAVLKEGIACYKTFIQGLLDVTDNLVDGAVVPPREVVRKDDDDTYLVVAADKGTATFSDIANEISINNNFWMGDAFASGGSAGYDHKAMGITAKGAWVSVQRHFREVDINVQDTDFTVVGIGDMGGDVFGNGMLLSEHIQLVCAFNHLHIFIDPNPDSAKSFVERKRLFEMPGSSWDDYNKDLISKGGAVFKRSAKSIDISPEMKKRFDISASKLAPTELISAVLKAPVDLLWNGGIGTYVKASYESHADVGDKANDILRVNGNELRCKVVGEGGNLGTTQLSRVEFALHGGHCNTDFIDNAAGVDCSDHEVNIKILLNELVIAGEMTEKQRNIILEEMTDSVSSLVLGNNYKQTQAISLAEREALFRLAEYRHLIQKMESSGRLNRQLEFIPDEEMIAERRAQGKALTRPELAVLISYVKSQLKEELVCTTVPEDDYMSEAVETAFPPRLRAEFNGLIYNHRLRKEIISTQLANDMVNHMGITYVDRMCQSTGVASSDVVRAYVTARDVFEMPTFWEQIESLDYKLSSQVQMQLMADLMRLVRRGSRWFIRNRRGLIEPANELALFKESVAMLRAALPDILHGDLKITLEKNYQHYIELGVPEDLASCIAGAKELYSFLGIIEAANALGAPVEKVAELYFSLAENLELNWFARQISDLKIENHWQAMARESYRDDLEWQLRTLTEGAMRHICKNGDVQACIDRWLEQQHLLVDRWRAMLSELHATQTHEFAMYSVAIRELLDMAQSSKYGEVEPVS